NPLTSPSIVHDIVPILRRYALLARIEHPAARHIRRGRRRIRGGLDFFLLELMCIYGRGATSSWNEHRGSFDSPFLRWVLQIHNALPADVQVRSTSKKDPGRDPQEQVRAVLGRRIRDLQQQKVSGRNSLKLAAKK